MTVLTGTSIHIAIDGPAGAGKSTIARMLAQRLDFLYIDTGAMYRACALFAIRSHIDFDDEPRIADMMEHLELAFRLCDGSQRLFLNGEDVSDRIRSRDVTLGSSDIARSESVRRHLVDIQRKNAQNAQVVMDGRDIGSFVLPDAQYKIFLTASDEVRARRRYLELESKGGAVPDFSEVLAELQYRDRQDRTRKISPLVCADDAIVIETGDLSIDEVVDRILLVVREGGTIG